MVMRFQVVILLFVLPLQAITVIPQQNYGAEIGRAFGEGFSKGMEEALTIKREKQLREQLEEERRLAADIDHYNAVVDQISQEQSHATITLPQELTKTFIHKGSLEMYNNRLIGFVFKRKFTRVLISGAFVEWVWSLDISNETSNKIFSNGSIKYPKAKIKIELFDSDNFVISSHFIYADLFLKRGETTTLHGIWAIPLDQISQVSNYKISVVNHKSN